MLSKNFFLTVLHDQTLLVIIFNYLLEWETRQKSVLLFKSLSYPESPLLALLLLVLGEGDSTFITWDKRISMLVCNRLIELRNIRKSRQCSISPKLYCIKYNKTSHVNKHLKCTVYVLRPDLICLKSIIEWVLLFTSTRTNC